MSEEPTKGQTPSPGDQPGDPRYEASEMERYFNDPEYRRKKSRKNLW